MFIQGTQANVQTLTFESLHTFNSTENQDIILLQMIENQLNILSIDNLETSLQQSFTLFNQILGNYDEKIMIDGQIHTLQQLVQLHSNIQAKKQLDQSQLNMLYLSIYRLDQQIQKERFVPIFKDILGEKFETVTLGDLNEVLGFADGKTGVEILAAIQSKHNISFPQNVLEKFVRDALMSGVQSVEAIESYVVQEVNQVEAFIEKLKNSSETAERLNILNTLPISRFHGELEKVQNMVVAKIESADDEIFDDFKALQRFVILETLRAKKAFTEEQLAKQEKTIEQKLAEQAMLAVDDKMVTTLSIS